MGKLAARPMPVSEPQQRRTRERQRLADAIAERNAAKAELLRIQQAQERHREEVAIPADKELETAQSKLEELQADEQCTLAAAYLGDAEAASMADAQRAVDEAKAAVEQADKTRQGLRAREGEAEQAVASAEIDLRGAFLAAASAAPEIAALCQRYESLRRELVALGRIMRLTEQYHPRNFLWNTPWQYDDARYIDLPTAELEQWRVALESLKSDADATLPDVELPSP